MQNLTTFFVVSGKCNFQIFAHEIKMVYCSIGVKFCKHIHCMANTLVTPKKLGLRICQICKWTFQLFIVTIIWAIFLQICFKIYCQTLADDNQKSEWMSDPFQISADNKTGSVIAKLNINTHTETFDWSNCHHVTTHVVSWQMGNRSL
jgi:hypothetical protein